MENLKTIQEKLRQLSDVIVIVEGKNDKAALELFGVSAIVTLEGKPLFSVVEEIVATGKPCVILTDLDKEGKKLFGILYSHLTQFGVQCDKSLRNELFRTELRQIEGLVRYLDSE